MPTLTSKSDDKEDQDTMVKKYEIVHSKIGVNIRRTDPTDLTPVLYEGLFSAPTLQGPQAEEAVVGITHALHAYLSTKTSMG